jgi:hypothetical protein
MRRFLVSFGITLLFLVVASDARSGDRWLTVSSGHCKVWISSSVEGEIADWNGAPALPLMVTRSTRSMTSRMAALKSRRADILQLVVSGHWGRVSI